MQEKVLIKLTLRVTLAQIAKTKRVASYSSHARTVTCAENATQKKKTRKFARDVMRVSIASFKFM